MKSIFEDKEFATYWNLRCGEEGEPFKRIVIDPILLQLSGSLIEKKVMEIGCGNGYFGCKLLELGAEEIILLDISKHNLDFARELVKSPKVEFIQHDITDYLDTRHKSVDVIFSNMVFSEIDNISVAFENAFKILRTSGKFIFSIIHPGWDIYEFARKNVGIQSVKTPSVQNYYYRGFTSFIMGNNNKEKVKLSHIDNLFEVEHFQRPLSDYINALTTSGFILKKMIEPEIPNDFMNEYPNFKEYREFPIVLIVACEKTDIVNSIVN